MKHHICVEIAPVQIAECAMLRAGVSVAPKPGLAYICQHISRRFPIYFQLDFLHIYVNIFPLGFQEDFLTYANIHQEFFGGDFFTHGNIFSEDFLGSGFLYICIFPEDVLGGFFYIFPGEFDEDFFTYTIICTLYSFFGYIQYVQ